jgi:hypothetical protein
MTIRLIPKYEDHLWYPILVRHGGYCRIVEMQGREANAWNDMVASYQTRIYPIGCI